jgi:hypothetical protein
MVPSVIVLETERLAQRLAVWVIVVGGATSSGAVPWLFGFPS